MNLDTASVEKTLAAAKEIGLLADTEVADVMAAFAPSFPFASAVELAATLHAHVKVDAVAALPHDRLRASGGVVENEKDGYVKYAFPSGLNLIFSSISISEDDLREAALPLSSRRPRPYLDHFGIDVRDETEAATAVFSALATRAVELGLPNVAQGGNGARVFCCHTLVAAKHWVFPNASGRTHAPPSIEFALGPLTIQAGASGCDLRPTNPALKVEPARCGAARGADAGH